jgi:hypothetical protein
VTPDCNAIGAQAPLRLGAWHGLRDERVAAKLIAEALSGLDGQAAQTLKSDHRSSVVAVSTSESTLVVKEVRKTGARRRLADRFRGSPARRAWTAGRRLIRSGIGAALPLAFLEQRTLGIPLRSLLVSLDLRAIPTAVERLGSPAQRLTTLAALADLAVDLHRNGAIHGDLRAQHVHLDTQPRLIDLESLRFRSRLSDAQRIEDLAQLNASIADDLASGPERRAAFDRYVSALPFEAAAPNVLSQIARHSIARKHLYRGSATC